mgnify:CR=1 FL=1
MEFKSRIYASSKGTTIDAIGQGQYLVCKPSGCTKVKGCLLYTSPSPRD